ncbi:MAG TPA: energy transducer TonB [Gemmatimonadales bacterium]|nr:energy transducer TonB [Gemmatimonadales bacterium]
MRRRAIVCLAAAAGCTAPPYVPPPPSPQRVYATNQVDELPEIVLTPRLAYPAVAGLAGIDGVVLVRLVVDTAGNPEPATTSVVQSPDSALGAAARSLVAKTLFRPARVRGRPVQVGLDLAVTFSRQAVSPVTLHFLDDVYRPDEVQEKPRVSYAPPLAYPGPLLLAGIQGRVVLRTVIDTLGRVEEATLAVSESTEPRFNEAAKDYLRKTRFTPARLAGRAVRVRLLVPVDFRLPSRD